MTGKAIIKFLIKHEITPHLINVEFEDDDYFEDDEMDDPEQTDKYKLWESLGEREEELEDVLDKDNENVNMIIYFKDHDVYIRADGYYTSYEGSNYSDSEWYEVKPKEVKVITYPKKGK